MNQMLQILYDQVKEKLEDDTITIEARNLLIEIKKEMKEMLKKEIVLDDLPEVEMKLSKFSKLLKELTCLE